jgi:hypothetical protein
MPNDANVSAFPLADLLSPFIGIPRRLMNLPLRAFSHGFMDQRRKPQVLAGIDAKKLSLVKKLEIHRDFCRPLASGKSRHIIYSSPFI